MNESYKASRKQHWLDRCIATNNFHAEAIKADPNWQYRNTADELGRSLGSISNDIKIARYLKDRRYSDKIRTFKKVSYAMEFIKEVEVGMHRELL